MAACLCGYGVLCPVHPKCPWCRNESTVFASGHKQFTCTRCKKVFDKKTVVGSCSSEGHYYPVPLRGSSTRICRCGKSTLKVNRNLDKPFYTAGETTMANSKKTVVVKKSVKKASKVERATRESNLEYRWVKPLKDEPNPETTYGTIYTTMRKIKRGSLSEVTDAAIKNGLAKFSDQDPTRMARIHLRYMVNGGAVMQSRNGEAVKTSVKSSKKEKGATKSFKLVKK